MAPVRRKAPERPPRPCHEPVTALDLMQTDCDLEETADDEPSLGCLDDLELDNVDEEGADAEPCPDTHGETVIWGEDLKSQEVLVESGPKMKY